MDFDAPDTAAAPFLRPDPLAFRASVVDFIAHCFLLWLQFRTQSVVTKRLPCELAKLHPFGPLSLAQHFQFGRVDVPWLFAGAAKAATRRHEVGKVSFLYQFGDHDPTGVIIPQSLETRLNEFCDKYDCPLPIIERIALTEAQIAEYRLPTRPTKRQGNTHALRFEGDSVELDALPSATLRDLVRDCIELLGTTGTS
jgi:hypothetical protein